MALSQRANIKAGEPNPIFEIFAQLYDPDTNPDGFYSLGIAENSLMHATLSAHLHENLALPLGGFTYGDGAKRLRDVLARFLTKHLKPAVKSIDAAHIFTVNGCTSAVEHLAWALTNEGESVLLGRPYYTSFVDDVTARTNSRIAEVSFDGVDPLGEGCVQKYRDTILELQRSGKPRAAALLLCHPHNPLGRCYPRHVLVGLMKLCQEFKIHLISDEIYALSVFTNTVDAHPSPTPFESVLSIDPQGIIDPALVHVIWGMSKDFGANGLRLGAIISQDNPGLFAALQPVSLFSTTSSLTEHATANALDDDTWVASYIAENQRLLGDNYAYVARWATDHSIEYAPGANAGFFIWLNLGAAWLKHHPEQSVLTGEEIDQLAMAAFLRHKVFLAAGFRFGSEVPGWFRIVFTHQRSYLDESLRRVLRGLEDPLVTLESS